VEEGEKSNPPLVPPYEGREMSLSVFIGGLKGFHWPHAEWLAVFCGAGKAGQVDRSMVGELGGDS